MVPSLFQKFTNKLHQTNIGRLGLVIFPSAYGEHDSRHILWTGHEYSQGVSVFKFAISRHLIAWI